MKRNFICMAIACTVMYSCKKDNNSNYNNNTKSSISIEFDNIVGSTDLKLNTGSYINGSGEAFKVTKLKYYISNLQFTNVDGNVYSVPQESSYFIIDESDQTTHQPIVQIPEGEYKILSFVIGVDSLRNTMDIAKRTGVLDPTTTAADMYWGWNSGYIFFKLEGTAAAATDNIFQYHVGGFGGYSQPTTNNLRTVKLDLSVRGIPQVKTGRRPNIHLFVDILKALTGTNQISFAATNMIHSSAGGAAIANNYVTMFTHDHTEND